MIVNQHVNIMKLNFFRKPTVAFDPGNRQHRADYAIFLKTNSWRHCSVHYEAPEVNGELQAVVQRTLLEYYTQREFSKILVDDHSRNPV